ncbi:hypothetical protein [Enterococcus casseliflavus]|nr:hypothetical protein [Enterococcus casseliflavus]
MVKQREEGSLGQRRGKQMTLLDYAKKHIGCLHGMNPLKQMIGRNKMTNGL